MHRVRNRPCSTNLFCSCNLGQVLRPKKLYSIRSGYTFTHHHQCWKKRQTNITGFIRILMVHQVSVAQHHRSSFPTHSPLRACSIADGVRQLSTGWVEKFRGTGSELDCQIHIPSTSLSPSLWLPRTSQGARFKSFPTRRRNKFKQNDSLSTNKIF